MKQKILKLFLYKKKLKFNEIAKSLDIRTNKLAYHIKRLVQEEVLTKNKKYYSLSGKTESLIPYLSEKKALLPAILIAIGNSKECYLPKRKKEPFLGKIGLPAGRIIAGESIPEAVVRILKEKEGIKAKIKKINSVSIEHTKKGKEILHSFLLIFVTAKTKNKIEYTNINKNKTKMIKSDYELIKNDLNKKINIKQFSTKL